jgi:acetyl-CoA carboxylase carboxyl transferase subunit alpha
MTGLRIPIVVVVVGEGGSGGALAIGVGDVVLALENAVYSVISPEGCAAILWRAPGEAKAAAAAMRMTAADQQDLGVVDVVVAEPGDGAHTDPGTTARSLRTAIGAALRELAERSPTELVTSRYARLRSIGAYLETPVPTAPPPEDGSLRRRLGRILHLPGISRRGRWSDVWPGDDESEESERGA